MAFGVTVAELRSERPSKFEYRDREKLFYVDDPALGFIRSMPIETFLQNFEGAAKAIIAMHASTGVPQTGAEVIPFRKAS